MRVAAFAAGVVALAAAVAAPAWAAAAADTLERAASPSALAGRSLLVAAARAGERLVVAGERGHVLGSDDGGANWQQASVPVSTTLTSLCFADAHTGWAVGHRGVILKSADGGRSWQRQLDGWALNRLLADVVAAVGATLPHEAAGFARDGADKPWLDVACLDAERVVAVGAFGLAVASADGGRSWTLLAELLRASGAKHLNAVAVHGDGILVAGEQGLLLQASAQGRDVRRLASPQPGSYFDIVATAAGDWLALGLRGSLARSADGGRTWVRAPSPSTQTFTSALPRADGSVLIADETGAVFSSVDGRAPFVRQPVDGAFPFVALVESVGARVIAVGARGVKTLEKAAVRPVAGPAGRATR